MALRWPRRGRSLSFVRRNDPPDRLDPGNDPAYPSSWSLRVVRRLPRPLVFNPEQVVLNFAFVLIGMAGFFSIEGSLIQEWEPAWIHIAWGLMMIVGGLSVLWGLFRRNTSVERLGYILVGPAVAWFGISALIYRGLPGLTVFGIFTAIALVKMIRMILSSAARDTVIEYGRKLDRGEDRPC